MKYKEDNKVKTYEEETGSNAAFRLNQHVTGIKRQTQKWALSKHLVEMHPDSPNDPNAFELNLRRIIRYRHMKGKQGVMQPSG